MAADLRSDVTELKRLLSEAKRPYVQLFLSTQIGSLEKLAADAEIRAAANPRGQNSATPEVKYTTLSNLSWEQDSERVKIYVSLEGVKEENVVSKFENWSFDVKFHDIDGKNYRFAIPKIHKEVDPEKCQVVIKSKRVIISLRKLEEEDWKDLHFKEDKSEEENKKEPMARL